MIGPSIFRDAVHTFRNFRDSGAGFSRGVIAVLLTAQCVLTDGADLFRLISPESF